MTYSDIFDLGQVHVGLLPPSNSKTTDELQIHFSISVNVIMEECLPLSDGSVIKCEAGTKYLSL